jgi:hypothetical protein
MALSRLAKPAWLTMSQVEWDNLTDYQRQELLRNAASTKAAPTAPSNIRSSKAQALLARLAESKEHTYALQELWIALEICKCAPDARQFQVWFRYDFDTIERAFEATAVWLSKMRGGEHPEAAEAKTHDHKVRYASGCMKKIKAGSSE